MVFLSNFVYIILFYQRGFPELYKLHDPQNLGLNTIPGMAKSIIDLKAKNRSQEIKMV